MKEIRHWTVVRVSQMLGPERMAMRIRSSDFMEEDEIRKIVVAKIETEGWDKADPVHIEIVNCNSDAESQAAYDLLDGEPASKEEMERFGEALKKELGCEAVVRPPAEEFH